MKRVINRIICCVFIILPSSIGLAQDNGVAGSTPFVKRYDITLKGDVAIIGNTIKGRRNDPNNNTLDGDASNGNTISDFNDIDSDPATFQSSSADYVGDSCNKVLKAYLYWAASYKIDSRPDINNYPINDPRPDFREVKFKLPGASNYIDITPTSGTYSTQVVYNGYRNTATNPSNEPTRMVPYVCYSDVTDLFSGLTDATGTYTVANIRAWNGPSRDIHNSGGWALVLVYENNLENSKYVSVFDGFDAITQNMQSEYDVNGFTTVPNGPVNAKALIAAIEGDRSNPGERFAIRANSNSTFTNIFNAGNPERDFFNSTITNFGTNVTTRLPFAPNTLGYDLDLFQLNNPLNSVIPNNETGATFRTSVTGDVTGVFLNVFSIDVIEPDLFVTKRVYDTSNNDITGGGVVLGQDLFYELTVQNLGNDDAVNAYILDDLPLNVDYIPGFLVAPPGVTVSYDAVLRQLRFDIDPNLVEVNDASFTIRFRVQVVDDCSELRDACSNIIENIANSFYQGVINTQPVTSDPSFSDIDGCNFGVTGSTNFLIDTDLCDFERNETICGNSLLLTAGAGYTSYTWRDSSGNVIGNTQSITVTTPGTYTVDKVALAPCVSDTETINVTFFTNLVNPLLALADNVQTCSINGELLPEFYLCGINDVRQINTSIQDAQSISWQQLDDASCAAQTNVTCPNFGTGCVWNQIGTGSNFTIDTAGSYRVRIDFPNGCFRIFYFNVYQNTLNPGTQLIDPIVCGNPGSFEVTNVPGTGYEFSLSPAGPWQSSPVFTNITTSGNYIVYLRQANGLPTACVYQTSVDVTEFDFDVQLLTDDAECAGGQGAVTIQIINGLPNYDFTITDNSGLNLTFNTIQSTHTFNNLDAGSYTAVISGANGQCVFTQNFDIQQLPALTATAVVDKDIDCTDGSITITANGGTPIYSYAIHSYNGTVVPTANYVFQGGNQFVITAGNEGVYEFIVVDQNNCTTITAPVTIDLLPAVNYSINTANPLCNGTNDGQIEIVTTGAVTGSMSYSIDNGVSFQTGNMFTSLGAGSYDIIVRNSINGNDCDQTDNVTLTIPNPLTADINLNQDLRCDADAIIEVTNATGGTAPYTYSVDGINFVNSTIFNVTSAGVYSVTVQDANGCTLVTPTVAVSTTDPVTDMTFVATDLSCPVLTSDITVSPVNGTAPFTYEIVAPAAAVINNANNAVFSGLSQGTYTFRVTDDRGCFYEENYTIAPLVPINVSASLVSNVTCLNDTDGVFDINVSGFTGTYSYTITGPQSFTATGQNAANTSFTGPAGSYTITVQDEVTNCDETTNIIVNAPTAALQIDMLDVIDFSCSATGVTDGSVSATVSGGWGGYAYRILQPDATVIGPSNNTLFNGLTQSGTYTYFVVDANGCEVSQTFDLSVPVSPVLDVSVAPSCYTAGSNTIATLMVSSGGTAPFQYRINSGSLQSSNVFNNLLPGSYTFEVVDAKNCTATATLTVNPELLSSASLIKGLDCTISPEALIALNTSGGSSSYTYELSVNGGAYSAYTGSFPFATTIAGDYRFRVSDTEGCQVETAVITILPITNPNIISLTQTQDILCAGDATASFDIAIDSSVGATPFEIFVNGTSYGTQTTISGLSAGTYTVDLVDDNDCSDSDTIVINEPSVITYSISTVQISCDVTNGLDPGSITVTNVNGGISEYTYYLSNNFGFSDQYSTTAGGEDHTFAILDFGIYSVVVEDANGCTVLTDNIIMASPPSDLDIVITGATTDCTTGASITVTALSALVSSNLEFAILETNVIPYSTTYLPPNSGANTRIFNGLTPGVTYTFVVHDLTTDCYYFETAPFPADALSTLTATVAPNDVTCTGSSDGSVSFTFDNYDGTTTTVDYQVFTSISNNPVSGIGSSPVNPPAGPVSVNNFGGPLPPGQYYILFTERGGTLDGCTTASGVFDIFESVQPLQLSVSSPVNDNCNVNAGQINAQGQFGQAPYEFIALLDTSPAPLPADPAWAASNIFNVEGGNYMVYIQDARGCITQQPVTVVTDPDIDIEALLVDACVAEGSYEVTVDIVGTATGIPNYSVSINSGAFIPVTSLPFTASGLSSGSNTFELRDSNGCSDIETITIEPFLNLTASVIDQPSCATNDGVITASTTGGSGNYSYVLNTAAGTSTGIAFVANEFNGVAVGSYIVVVTDQNTLCTAQVPITLESPELPVLLASTITNVSCNGASDASIVVNLDPATTANGPYTYELIDETTGTSIVGPQGSSIFDNLEARSYRVRVISARDCTADEVVQITEPSALSISASATPFVCNSNNQPSTSTITVTVDNDMTGSPSGTAPYLYSIDGTNFQTSNVFTVNDNGTTQTFTVSVTDSNGCGSTETVLIDALSSITGINVSSSQELTCTTDENVTVTVTGGSGVFTYTLLPAGPTFTNVASNSQSFTLTASGGYTFEVIDEGTGCTILSTPFTVDAIPDSQVTATADQQVSCFGLLDGSLFFSVTNYTGSYDYDVIDSSGTIVQSGTSSTTVNPVAVTGLAGGAYTIEITETNVPFCNSTSNTVTIASPIAALQLDLSITNDLTCNPGNDAQITAIASGGWGTPYVYSIDGTNFVTANSFPSLGAGTYTIYVRDSGVNFCETMDTIVIDLPNAITATIASTDLSCNNSDDGTIVAVASGGQGAGTYNYILNGPSGSSSTQTTGSFTNLSPGTYTVTVNDDLNCEFTTTTATIANPTLPTASVQLTQPYSCDNLAEITVTGSNGVAPYEYSEDGVIFTPNNLFTNLGPGTYSYTVRDSNGCISNVSTAITINPIDPLAASVDLTDAIINCASGTDGTLLVIATGGLGNYMYELIDTTTATTVAGPQSNGFFSNVAAGNYFIRVTSGDCLLDLTSFIITEPDPIAAAVSSTDVTCFSEDDGTITITASGGVGGYIYSIDQLVYTGVNTFIGLAPDDYTVYVQDSNGCFEQFDVTINEPAELNATATILSSNICSDDDLNDFEVQITGGTAPYTISLDNVNFDPVTGNSYVFTGVDTGFYNAIVVDSNGCNVTTNQVNFDPGVEITGDFQIEYYCDGTNELTIINTNPQFQGDLLFSLNGGSSQMDNVFDNVPVGVNQVEIVEINTGCSLILNNIDVEAFTPLSNLNIIENPVNTFTISWQGGEPNFTISVNDQITNSTSFEINRSGTYTVRITDDRGCVITQVFDLEYTDITIPNVFTPNGDGDNDVWLPGNLFLYPNAAISIYDRYGRELKRFRGISNGWDGTYQGNLLPSGDYWYSIELNDDDNREFTGHFTLYR